MRRDRSTFGFAACGIIARETGDRRPDGATMQRFVSYRSALQAAVDPAHTYARAGVLFDIISASLRAKLVLYYTSWYSIVRIE